MIIKYADGETMEIGYTAPPKSWAETRAEKILLPKGYRLADSFKDDGTVLPRVSRKEYRCFGGHNGERWTKCQQPIKKGDVYIEYIGESPLYESGHRHHLECAAQQGLIKRVSDDPSTPAE